MIATTKEYLAQKIPAIYEATFEYQGVLVMVDILKVNEDGVSIYEVKSSTALKSIYLHDVAIQYYVLNSLGLTIKSVNVVTINNEYIKEGEIEPTGLFTVHNVTQEVKAMQSDIPVTLGAFERYLDDKEHEPDIDIGRHCNDPNECDAKTYCWQIQRGIPQYSIFDIFNLGSKKQIALYQKGIVKIEDIPDDFEMTPNQASAVANYKSQSTSIDRANIQAFCDGLRYPIYHLDFETFQQVIPQFDGICPYQQIPFQYSLHIQHANGSLEHKEFLAEDNEDLREAIARQLVADIPTNVTVLAYSMSFEKGVIERLASTFDNLSSHLLSINANMQDLMIPFQKRWYVTPDMQGSYSIKYVLPALVPELKEAYKELDLIHNGSEAMNAFATLSTLEAEEKRRVRAALKAYCRLDTLAMVKILERLRAV
ncbi:MAG: DUF2779 domain-containing protein [Campylobacterales bacterium]|nr:DUF2779 domain-containing protein [Campylobacterales bacterium]